MLQGRPPAPAHEVLIHLSRRPLQMIGSLRLHRSNAIAPDGSREPAPLVRDTRPSSGWHLGKRERGRIAPRANTSVRRDSKTIHFAPSAERYILVNELAEYAPRISVILNAVI